MNKDNNMSPIKLLYKVFLLIWAIGCMAAAHSVLGLSQKGGGDRNRKQRDISCRQDSEHLHDNICCVNCPAGTYVKEFCTREHERGTCETCDFETYTEHDNGLPQCLKCTKCRPDQVPTRMCNITRDTECQCKPGYFCAPDQACEICKKCSRCKEHEVQVGECSSTSNTVCKTRVPKPGTISGTTLCPAVVIGVTVVVIVILVLLGFFWKRRLRRKRRDLVSNSIETPNIDDDEMPRPVEESQINQTTDLDHSQFSPLLKQNQLVRAEPSSAPDDEDNGLGDSLPNTANSSQSNLSAIPPALFPRSSPLPSPLATRQPGVMSREICNRKLSPLNGEDSLKRCFEFFEELDINYYKRFFRHLGLSDNAIANTAHLSHEDRVYELLKVWLEKVFTFYQDIN
ncbi:hypothetical protein UPYG_G00181680 [Umbra pygmaea]|uniref:TNFR-Cys domain-containing protein n=1 Tax=Umbra pygmaea TaxID=75934 RepID=A0ABD0XBP3_UMBPY